MTNLTAVQKEARQAMLLRQNASIYVRYRCQPQDIEASKLALLWAAFEAEAMAQGLTTWRGVVLGDDAAEGS